MHTPEGFTPGHALPPALAGGAIVFAWHDGKLLVRDGEHADAPAPSLPCWDECMAWGADDTPHYLGALQDVPCVTFALAAAAAVPEGWRPAGLRSLFFALPEPLLALAGRAFQIVEWDRTHRFCGHCGTPLVDKPDERARTCPACGLTAYPRVSPAMMVLVTRGREMLLARAPHFKAGMFSALAGFVEPGETVEDCIRREVREEVGIAVRDPVYFGSQSWAFPHSLMLAFTAEYAGGELAPAPDEIAEAHWFRADAMPPLPASVSIARRLIEATAARLAAMR